jgi:hypothetical protein
LPVGRRGINHAVTAISSSRGHGDISTSTIEAEFANPPIPTPEIEEHILPAPIGDLADDSDVQVILSPTTTIAPSVHARTRDVEAEADGWGEVYACRV